MVEKDFEFLDFKTINEDWSVYRLNDGTILKVKFVLIKVRKHKQLDKYGNPIYDANSKNVVGIIPNMDLLGEPSPPTPPEKLAKSIVAEDIPFETVAEPWNEYELDDGTTLKIRLVLTIASRTSKFDSYGEPIYLTNSQAIVKGKTPPPKG